MRLICGLCHPLRATAAAKEPRDSSIRSTTLLRLATLIKRRQGRAE